MLEKKVAVAAYVVSRSASCGIFHNQFNLRLYLYTKSVSQRALNNLFFYLEPTCKSEIKDIISQLKEGYAGNYGIFPKYLNCVLGVIVYPLTGITNLPF